MQTKNKPDYSAYLSDNHIQTGVFILYSSSRLMLFISGILKPFNLTFQQFNVLRILRESNSIVSIKYLAEKMIDPNSNCSRLVDKLVKKDLARRIESETDKRIVNVEITEAGCQLVDKASTLVLTQFKDKMDVFSDEELQVLNNTLVKMNNIILKKSE